MGDLLQVQICCPFKCLRPNLFQSLHFIYFSETAFLSLNSQSLFQICSFVDLYEALI